MAVTFGVSSHLYVADRLDRDHLVEIAAHGFDALEIFALRGQRVMLDTDLAAL